MKEVIYTKQAPDVIGSYSQAIKVGNTVFLSGQIPLNPETMQLVTGNTEAEIHQVFKNLAAVAKAAGGSLANVVKLSIFLTDLSHFPLVNSVMAQYFSEPYPARSTVEVSALPKGVSVEMDAVLMLDSVG